jgi:hypothetical protein
MLELGLNFVHSMRLPGTHERITIITEWKVIQFRWKLYLLHTRKWYHPSKKSIPEYQNTGLFVKRDI